MPFNKHFEDRSTNGQPEDNFALVDFLAEAPDYFAYEPFSIHVRPRSSDIHEYLNLKIQLKIGRLHKLKKKIQAQIRSFNRMNSPSGDPEAEKPAPAKVEKKSTQQAAKQIPRQQDHQAGKLIYRKGGKVIEIAVSSEQLHTYFEKEMMEVDGKENKQPQEAPRSRDIFDRFLQEPGFFKRSEDPEAVPPDAAIEASVTEDEEIVTETLAKIHLLQGNQKEAKKIYHKLSLLFPEKSAYFEAQIQKIQDLDTKNNA